MSVRVEVEEIETTRSEKLLAVVLAVFVLVAGLWTYSRIDDFARHRFPATYVPSTVDAPAIQRLNAAEAELVAARARSARTLGRLELRREAYRTALDAGRPAGALGRAYDQAERAYGRARRARTEAAVEVAAARGAAEAARGRTDDAAREQERNQTILAVSLRGAFIAVLLAAGYLVLGRLRRRGSRYFPLAVSLVAAAAVLALVMAGDYITDYVNPAELGPLLLSVAGAALTIAAFVGLQRYLRRRLPLSRVRHGRCPFCGYPARGNRHCEGCGRAVIAECTACDADRRVGAVRCGACGAT